MSTDAEDPGENHAHGVETELYEESYLKYHQPTREKLQGYAYWARSVREEAPRANRLLDVGCAFGDFLKEIETFGIDTHGVDISKLALERASANCEAKLTRVDINNQPLPFQDGFFDVVTAFAVLEHISGDSHFLNEARRVLSNDGLFLAKLPTSDSIFASILPEHDHTHINVKGFDYWRALFEKTGFRRVRFKYITLHTVPPFGYWARQKLRLPTWYRPVGLPTKALTQSLVIYANK